MNHLLKEYFSLTNSQRRAIIVLSSLIALTSLVYLLLPKLIPLKSTPIPDDLQCLVDALEEDTSFLNTGYSFSADEKINVKNIKPFPFDPNKLDEAGFKKLGLRAKLISTILNYRSKGGRFYNKESLKRIYGLRPEEYQQLKNYISIPQDDRPSDWNKRFKESRKQEIIELNTADTSLLKELKGIGSKLSVNIVKRREQLGGYAIPEQLKEVFGISEETYKQILPFIKIDKTKIKQLNINAATYYELNAHPYLRGEIALAMVEYRKAHDYKFKSLLEIKEIELINEELFRKIVPYLRIN